jgi:hypothetical protein
MIVLAREVFVCKCSTDVPAPGGDAGGVRFEEGGRVHYDALDRAHHDGAKLAEFDARLARGERWLVGFAGRRIATYTWLHGRDGCDYPYLPGCVFALPPDVGYGYDAWTAPDLRGGGLRRRAFVEELRWLRAMGKRWEASFFVAYQLDGARRSLATAGIDVQPLWRVSMGRDRRLALERIADDDGGIAPAPAQET